MKPRIIKTRFGGISFQGDGEKVDYSHDTLIRLDGKVRERRKKLSKQIYGTSHTLSLAEAEYIYEEGAEMLLIGTGQFGLVELSDEAAGYFGPRLLRCSCSQRQKRSRHGTSCPAR